LIRDKVSDVSNDVNNATDPFPPEEAEPEVPIHRPLTGDATPSGALPHDESVETEAEVGPDDLTGQTDEPIEESAAADEPIESSESSLVSAMDDEPEVAEPTRAVFAAAESEEDVPINRQWYILKVQTNREESIRDALQRRVAMAGLEKYFGEVIVPTEMVSEFKGGKKRVSKRKLYPGYIVVNMEINDDTWYLVRETSGIGDFTGAMGRPTPMAPQDVAKIVAKTEEKTDEAPRVDIRFKPSDRVRIKDGTFENFEGNVETIDQANGRVTVMINIFGRSTPVELEYWQIEAV
jgi:transcriptional antiterminator NusG